MKNVKKYCCPFCKGFFSDDVFSKHVRPCFEDLSKEKNVKIQKLENEIENLYNDFLNKVNSLNELNPEYSYVLSFKKIKKDSKEEPEDKNVSSKNTSPAEKSFSVPTDKEILSKLQSKPFWNEFETNFEDFFKNYPNLNKLFF